MGFRGGRKTIRMDFEDPEFDGLEVAIRSMSMEQFLEFTTLAEEASSDLGAAEELIRRFSAALVEWNLEEPNEDGEWRPVPPTADGLRRQDFSFVLFLANEWLSAVTNIGAGLGKGSTSGGSSLEGSIPMEVP